jgi:hypothetical protein
MKFLNIFSTFNLFLAPFNNKYYYSLKIFKGFNAKKFNENYNNYIIYDDVFDIFDNIKPLNSYLELIICNTDEDCYKNYKCCNNTNISISHNFCCIDNNLIIPYKYFS